MIERNIRRSWVYWLTLVVICGQLALWIVQLSSLFQSLRPFLALLSPTELVQAMIQRTGLLRFIHFYVFGLFNIGIYLVIVALLLLVDPRAKTVFLISVLVVVAQQAIDAFLTLTDGSLRDWVTTGVGNLALGVFLWLLYMAFRHLFANGPSNLKDLQESLE